MSEPLLEIRDLCIDFRTPSGRVRAVDSVSFTIGTREILGLVGESGSGKTITMLAALGLITDPNAIISGAILFRGQDLRALPPRALRAIRGRDIAMIFQDPMSAMTPVHPIGWQIVEQIQAHARVSAKAARARAVALLGQMGIPDPAAAFARYPHQLSGGLRQRAMIAMALSCAPALIIADEPTTALDVTVQAQILALLADLCRDVGSSIVLITHDMGVVADIARRVMVMYAGRLVERGATREMFAHPRHPYTRGLLAAIPPIEGDKPHRLMAIPGAPPSPAEMPAGCAFQPRCPIAQPICAARPPLAAAGAQHVACFLAAAPAP